MTRRLLIAALFLLAGAVVNVAVAWGCAISVDPYTPSETERAILTKAQDHWEVHRTERPGLTVLTSSRRWMKTGLDARTIGPPPETLLPSWSDMAKPTDDFRSQVDSQLHERVNEMRILHCLGWPFRGLSCDWTWVSRLNRSLLAGGAGFIETPFDPWRGLMPRVLPTGRAGAVA